MQQQIAPSKCPSTHTIHQMMVCSKPAAKAAVQCETKHFCAYLGGSAARRPLIFTCKLLPATVGSAGHQTIISIIWHMLLPHTLPHFQGFGKITSACSRSPVLGQGSELPLRLPRQARLVIKSLLLHAVVPGEAALQGREPVPATPHWQVSFPGLGELHLVAAPGSDSAVQSRELHPGSIAVRLA